MAPPSFTVSNSERAFLNTRVCISLLLGSPSVAPRGWGSIRVRGGRTFFAIPSNTARVTVGMPPSSIFLASRPPDWVQTGQTRTRRAQSTSPARSCSRISAPVVSMKYPGFAI